MEKRAKNILGHKSPSEFFSNKTQKIFQILVLGLGSPTKCMSIIAVLFYKDCSEN